MTEPMPRTELARGDSKAAELGDVNTTESAPDKIDLHDEQEE